MSVEVDPHEPTMVDPRSTAPEVGSGEADVGSGEADVGSGEPGADPHEPDAVSTAPDHPAGKGQDALEMARLRAATRAKLFGGEPEPTTIGRYRIVEQLGAGGMGVVYLAHDDDLDRRVAVKVLRAGTKSDSPDQARLIREAQAMAKLSHPNVVHVYEVGRQDALVFIAMEHIPGQNLRQWSSQPRSVEQVLAMHRQAGRGLAAAHGAGIVHRDYKPENVLVGERDRARVLDFGLARPDESFEEDDDAEPTDDDAPAWHGLTKTGTVLGTPAYMAPEQFAGEVADARADQFAYCVTLFEALYGTRPFAGDTMAKLSRAVMRGLVELVEPADFDVPADVHEALMRGLSTRPDDRFPSMDALLEALEPPTAPTLREPARRGWIPGVLLVALLAVGLVLVLVIQRGGSPTDNAREPGDAASTTEPEAYAEILAATDLPETLSEPLPDDPFGVTVHRLSNGLTVYVAPDHDMPLMSAVVMVRAGSVHEPPGGNGVARLVQRLIGEGTGRLGALDFAAEQPLLEQRDALVEQLEDTDDPARRRALLTEIEAVVRQAADHVAPLEAASVLEAIGSKEFGSATNALGSFFFADLPSARFEAWATLQAEQLRAPVFRGLFGELKAISEELRDEQGTTFEMARESRRALFEGTPFEHWFLGSRQDLARPPFSAMRRFHQERYVPNNMAIAVVGDIDAETALPIIERTFGAWPPGSVEPTPAPPPSLPPGRRAHTVPSTVPVRLTLMWRAPDASSEATMRRDDAVAVILREVHDRLDEAGLHVGLNMFSQSNAISAYLQPTAGEPVEAVEAAFFEALHAVAREGPSAEFIAAARARRTRETIERNRNTTARTIVIVHSYLAGGDWPQTVTAMNGAVDRAAVDRVLDTLRSTGYVAATPDPDLAPAPLVDMPTIGPIDYPRTTDSEFFEQLLAIPTPPLEPQFIFEGRHYAAQQRDGRLEIATELDDGLTTVGLVYPVGFRDDRWVCLALDLWLQSGLADQTHRELFDGFARPGVSLSSECGANHSEVWITLLDEHLDESWPRVEELLLHPVARADDLERIRRWERDGRKIDVDFSDAIMDALGSYALHGAASRRRLGPSDAELAEVSLRRLTRRLDALRATPPAVVISGAAKRLRVPSLGSGPTRAPSAVTIPRPTRPRLVVLDDDAVDHAAVRLVLTRDPLSLDERMLADLMRLYLVSGRTRVLPHELLLSRSLLEQLRVHYVWPSSPEDDTQLVMNFSAPPERVAEFLELLSTTLRRPVDPERFDAALTSLEGEYRGRRLAPSAVPYSVLSWIQAGLEADPLQAKWAGLSRATPAMLEAFKDTMIAHAPIIAIRGDLDRIGRAELERLGAVEVVTREDIFGPDL